ncbi:MAG: LysR family transcriptional regulator [Pseudomonadota bacterium]
MTGESLRPDGDDATDAPGLTLRALRIFMAVEEAGSLTAAAARIGASPSTVSQQISNLERSVGARVFDRSAKPVALTPVGLLLRRHAHRILEAVSEARTELMELSLAALPELRLAIIDDLDASITPDLVGHLQELYPKCLFSATSGGSDGVNQALQARAADIAVSAEAPNSIDGFDLHPLLQEPFIIATAPGAVERGHDVLGQLMARPYVHFSPAMPMGRAIARHLRRLKLDPPQRYSFNVSRSVFAMVRNCQGWTITTPLSVLDSERFPPELDVMPLPFSGFSRTISLIARRDELGKLPEKLARLCRQLIEERLRARFLEIAPWAEADFRMLGDQAAARADHG